MSLKFITARSTIRKIWLQFLDVGSPTRKQYPQISKPKKLKDQDLEFIQVLKNETPSLTTREIRHQLLSNSDIQDSVSIATVNRAVRNDMYTDKKWTFKRLKGPSVDRFTDANLRYTQAYVDYIFQQDPTKVLLFDESGFKHTNADRKYGHSEIGTRCVEVNKMKDRANLTLN